MTLSPLARRTLPCVLPFLLVVLSCGDAQLDTWEDSPFLFVAPLEWSSRYSPGLDAFAPFPGLEDVEDPRLDSSNPEVVTAKIFRGDLNDPDYIAAHLRSMAEGDAEIRLWDGDRLVRSETVQVRSPESVEFEIVPPVELPSSVVTGDTPLSMLLFAPALVTVRFIDSSGQAVVGAGVAERAHGMDIQEWYSQDSYPAWAGYLEPEDRTRRGVYRSPGEQYGRVAFQVSDGDQVLTYGEWGGSGRSLSLRRPLSTALDPSLTGVIDGTYRSSVVSLEVITENVGGTDTQVTVLGRTRNGVRVIGLDPVVAADDGYPPERESDLGPWIKTFEEPIATVHVSWRELSITVEVDQ